MHLNIIPLGLMLLGDSGFERLMRMKNTPTIFSLKAITCIQIIGMVAMLIVNCIDGQSLDVMAFYAIIMLAITLLILCPMLVSLDNRIRKLEGMADDSSDRRG